MAKELLVITSWFIALYASTTTTQSPKLAVHDYSSIISPSSTEEKPLSSYSSLLTSLPLVCRSVHINCICF